MEIQVKLKNGAVINVNTELTPGQFYENFDEFDDLLVDELEEMLQPAEEPEESNQGNTLNFEGGKHELYVIITDRFTGYNKRFHLQDAEIDNQGIVTLILDKGNGKKDTLRFPYTREYRKYHNFAYFIEVASTKEALK